MRSPVRHEAGGKVKLPMMRGMRGNAHFVGDNGQFRPWLSREWAGGPQTYWLWIGANPSTAAASIDDPTIRKELNFTIKGGGRGYRKANVLDYRATNPRDLLKVSEVRSGTNLTCLQDLASDAEKIICAWGAMNKRFESNIGEVLAILSISAERSRIYCLGLTAGGQPRHPLYVSYETKLEPFDVATRDR